MCIFVEPGLNSGNMSALIARFSQANVLLRHFLPKYPSQLADSERSFTAFRMSIRVCDFPWGAADHLAFLYYVGSMIGALRNIRNVLSRCRFPSHHSYCNLLEEALGNGLAQKLNAGVNYLRDSEEQINRLWFQFLTRV